MGKIAVLGAGITGLCTAYELSKKYGRDVVLLEKNDFVGGLAATIERDGLKYDLGSHRIHNDTDAEIVSYIENILGEKLLKRPRNGKFYFFGKYLQYPPNAVSILREFKIFDLFLFGLSYGWGHLTSSGNEKNFEDVMMKRVGVRAYQSFYRDYAKKLWGVEPMEIAADVGRRSRFLGGSQLFKQVLFKDKTTYFYPEGGIGKLAEKFSEKIIKNGGEVLLEHEVVAIKEEEGSIKSITVKGSTGRKEIEVDKVISTLSIDDFYNMSVDEPIKLRRRGVRLVYFLVEDEVLGDPETYYFPHTFLAFGRVSFIQKYSPGIYPPHMGTLITVEVPSSFGDEIWDMNDDDLEKKCIKDLVQVKIVDEKPKVKWSHHIKINNAYSIYEIGWKEKFLKIYKHIENMKDGYTLGRGGLFLHCNMDHSILQAKKITEHIKSEESKEKWNEISNSFLNAYARE